jgi:hypothetical protein
MGQSVNLKKLGSKIWGAKNRVRFLFCYSEREEAFFLLNCKLRAEKNGSDPKKI